MERGVGVYSMFVNSFIGTIGAFGNFATSSSSFKELLINDTDVDVLTVDGDGGDRGMTIPTQWGYGTILFANFNNSLQAGNLDYSTEAISLVRIKKRIKGEFEWQTIYEKSILSNSDFNFEFYDYLEPSGEDVEYAYVPILSQTGLEGNIIVNEIRSEFEGFFFVEKDRVVWGIFNSNNTKTLNRETAVQTTLGRKYPFVIENGIINYYSGTLQASFLPTENCVIDLSKVVKYERDIDEFLSNHKPKLLKDFMGNMWLVQVVSNIPRKSNDPRIPVHSVDWVEVGNAKSVSDLYNHDIVDIDVNRRLGGGN